MTSELCYKRGVEFWILGHLCTWWGQTGPGTPQNNEINVSNTLPSWSELIYTDDLVLGNNPKHYLRTEARALWLWMIIMIHEINELMNIFKTWFLWKWIPYPYTYFNGQQLMCKLIHARISFRKIASVYGMLLHRMVNLVCPKWSIYLLQNFCRWSVVYSTPTNCKCCSVIKKNA